MDNLDQDKKTFLLEILKHAPLEGWNNHSINLSTQNLNWNIAYITLLFPNGICDIIEYFTTYIDTHMIEALKKIDLSSMKISARIYIIVQTRLNESLPYRPAIAKMISYCTLPQNALHSINTLWRTADNIWVICKDQSADFNYYTKRLILSGVYSSTLLYWINDYSDNQIETMHFLQRRINDALKISKFKYSLKNTIQNIPFIRLLNK
ncbi:MAG: COQ9 family protein [Rickettsiales endosymbiont of Dermacentor nuttalli]